MSKVHIGPKNGRYGVWVAAGPSDDASGEGDRMILDSDRDALLIHHRQSYTVNGVDTGSAAEQRYNYNGTEFAFPALPYIPVVTLFWRWNTGVDSDDRLYFPPSSHLDKSSPIGTVDEAFPLLYYTDRVVIQSSEFAFEGLSWASQIIFTLYVYKNKLRDA